ncbi:LysR family transcriptional regulator [Leptonema illini]|uniref:Transcriptional regulator, LysR family n=1 Tax=Leptonema illini DSM 21528 TaxID=929563 RepID=H2CF00_9LEPT|nr:LysR family transcriptional regulator [Leptonema illini]EHQ05603.1 transcriptional regulator, LysR family [Leptonema illini DSM 21528]
MVSIRYSYDMDFQRLRSFAEIVRCQSFTAASRRLNLTQPALSRQMALLEREVGAELFVRSGRLMLPTPAAERLYAIALEAEDLERRMTGEDELKNLHIAVGGSAGVGIIPPILARLREDFPALSIRITESLPAELQRLAASGVADIVIHEPFSTQGMLVSEPLYRDRVQAMVGMAPARMTLKQLRLTPLLLFEKGSSLRRAAEQILQPLYADFESNVMMELRTIAALQASLLAVSSVGFLSSLTVTERIRPLRLSGAVLSTERTFLLSHLRGRRLQPYLDGIRKAIPPEVRIRNS